MIWQWGYQVGFLSKTFRVYLYKLYIGLRMLFLAWDQVVIQYDKCGKSIECMYNLAASVEYWFLINKTCLRLFGCTKIRSLFCDKKVTHIQQPEHTNGGCIYTLGNKWKQWLNQGSYWLEVPANGMLPSALCNVAWCTVLTVPLPWRTVPGVAAPDIAAADVAAADVAAAPAVMYELFV